jgi:hypothetical protein
VLAPVTRVLLTDALQPPAGYRVDVAVATTYSLDLTALLLAPMTFALHDDDLGDLDAIDPIKLLEAVRRHAEHTTVFVQAGAIAVPSSYRRILTFTEECVHEVTAPGGLFHPKVWILRFSDAAGTLSHRMVCLSRNLTFDRSWDTVLVLDQPDGESIDAQINTAPLARFLGELPRLVTRPLSEARAEQIQSLGLSVQTVSLTAPPGFTAGALLPLGFSWSEKFPLPESVRSATLSPFLDATTARRLGTSSRRPLLISRPETLDRLGAGPLEGIELFVLQRAAEREVGADLEDSTISSSERSVPEGLHAKTFVFEQGRETTMITGSANATGAGMSANVEFDVVLTGPSTSIGVASMWDGSREAPGFSQLCQPYSAPDVAVNPADSEATGWAIEQYHAQLAVHGLVAAVTALLDDSYRLELTLPSIPSPGVTTVWPITLPAATWSRDIGQMPVAWQPLSVGSITPMFVVSTTAGTGAARCTVAAVLTAELVGDPEHRRRDALADVLRTQADVLRYLAFLLGDAALSGGVSLGEPGSWLFGDGPGGFRHDIVLFEPLVKALADGGGALKRVASLHEDLVKLPNGAELVPEGWEELWQAVWSAHLQHAEQAG